MKDERGRFVVTAGQDDQAPHPGFRDAALSQSTRKIIQPRLFGIRFSGFEGVFVETEKRFRRRENCFVGLFQTSFRVRASRAPE